MEKLNETKVGKYLLTYPSDIKSETFSEESYNGIIFYVDDFQYEVIHNYAMDMERLYISQRNKYPSIDTYLLNHDVPFKPSTFGFLPSRILAREL